MNSDLESGLFLPIRFYATLAEQERYKRQMEGIALLPENYIHVDCKTLAPFQVVFQQMALNTSVSWKLVCADDTTEIDMPYNASHWEEFVKFDEQLIWTSYLGNDDFTGLISNGKYYVVLTIVDANNYTRVFYSDFFMVSNCDEFYDTQNYRKFSPSNTDLRKINVANDLRIITNP